MVKFLFDPEELNKLRINFERPLRKDLNRIARSLGIEEEEDDPVARRLRGYLRKPMPFFGGSGEARIKTPTRSGSRSVGQYLFSWSETETGKGSLRVYKEGRLQGQASYLDAAERTRLLSMMEGIVTGR